MQSYITLLFLLTISFLAAANPLDKRYTHGFVGSYNDPNCLGDFIRDTRDPTSRPKITGNNCYPFHPRTNNIGINFGSGIFQYESLLFFTDSACKSPSGIPTADCPNPWGPGMGCVHPDQYGDRTGKGNYTVGSVRVWTTSLGGEVKNMGGY